jgi:sensor histidine kinase YesM
MNRSWKKSLMWTVIALVVFAVFRWLAGMAMPGAALAFASGATAIIMGGLIAGHYATKAWFPNNKENYGTTVAWLITGILAGLILIGFFVSRMIAHTDFADFFFTVIALFAVNAFAAMIITLIRQRIRSEIHTAQAAAVQSKTELQVLQAQMSPHFLFNTLNNLYGLSITDHGKVPELLLKLSELLRYSVYDAKETFVPLRDEITYLKNYIEFEKIRLGERLVLSLEIQDASTGPLTLAPMLLIVFLENAFKHSKNNEDERVYIDIALRADNDSIHFFVKNSCAPASPFQTGPKTHSGFGLESVKKRLHLLYANRHTLAIQQQERSYTVTLSIKNS